MKMKAFDPYVTYVIHSNEREFYNPNGNRSFDGWEMCARTREHSINELYILGKQAFDILGEFDSAEQFQNAYKFYLATIKEYKSLIYNGASDGHITIVGSETGEKLDRNALIDIESHEVLRAMLEMTQSINAQSAPTQNSREIENYLIACYVMAVLENINHALIDIMINDDGVGSGIIAANCLSNYLIYSKDKLDIQEIRTEMGRQAAKMRLKKDPKQQEKQFIKECWNNWQTNKSQYKSKAAFARDMLDKVENLTSAKKVEDWCREWEKETTTQPVQ